MKLQTCLIWIMLLGFNAAVAQTTFDPLSIGVGARALGMGRAYVAVAENTDTIFTNPAGLGEIDSFEFVSMSGSLFQDVNYTVLGSVYPLGAKSAFGLGYVNASLSGIEIRDNTGTLQQTTSFGNSVIIASYGRKLSEKLSLGLNFKYYSQDGNRVTNANGSGMNFDIGLLQKGLGWLSLGVVAQNVLSSGKIHYKNGTEDDLPLNIKVGTRMFLMGEKYETAFISPIELTAVIDADLDLQAAESTTLHFGLEFAPSPYLTLRTGIDQDPVPGGIVSNTTYGLSLKYAGLGFHYAYHPYGEIPANATSYFSISFDERGWPFEGLPETFLGLKDQPALLQI